MRPPTRRNQRKGRGSNFAIWQPCSSTGRKRAVAVGRWPGNQTQQLLPAGAVYEPAAPLAAAGRTTRQVQWLIEPEPLWRRAIASLSLSPGRALTPGQGGRPKTRQDTLYEFPKCFYETILVERANWSKCLKKPGNTVHSTINRFLGMHPNCWFPELALALNGICPKETGAKLCRTAMCAKMIKL